MKKLLRKIIKFCEEGKLGKWLLYYSRQISCVMLGICYVFILLYIPTILPRVIHIKTYVNNPELDIYMNFHALFLIMVIISVFIALKPVEKQGDYALEE